LALPIVGTNLSTSQITCLNSGIDLPSQIMTRLAESYISPFQHDLRSTLFHVILINA
jgi:hypothetical protein